VLLLVLIHIRSIQYKYALLSLASNALLRLLTTPKRAIVRTLCVTYTESNGGLLSEQVAQ